MTERAERLGGTLELNSTLGSGTTLLIRPVPLRSFDHDLVFEISCPTPIRLLLIDDHAVMRAGLANMLNANSNFQSRRRC
jgi:hypothetical protein